MKSSFYTPDEIEKIGFKSYGRNLLISRFASFYNASKIEIGSNVRIDDYCILSGEIKLGNFIHIAAYSALYGKFGIEMKDFTGVSPRCTIFSASDDFSGEYLISPMSPKRYTNVTGGKVTIHKFSQIGAGSIILPNVTIYEGVAVGAMSLVKSDLDEWGIYAGIPAQFIRARSKRLLDFYKEIVFNE